MRQRILTVATKSSSEMSAGSVHRKIVDGLGFAFRPFDEQPFLARG